MHPEKDRVDASSINDETIRQSCLNNMYSMFIQNTFREVNIFVLEYTPIPGHTSWRDADNKIDILVTGEQFQ